MTEQLPQSKVAGACCATRITRGHNIPVWGHNVS